MGLSEKEVKQLPDYFTIFKVLLISLYGYIDVLTTQYAMARKITLSHKYRFTVKDVIEDIKIIINTFLQKNSKDITSDTTVKIKGDIDKILPVLKQHIEKLEQIIAQRQITIVPKKG